VTRGPALPGIDVRRLSLLVLALAPAPALAFGFGFGFAASPAAAAPFMDREATAKPATVSTSLTASREDVYKAVKEALVTWKLRLDSLEDGIVKTEWVNRQKGDEKFRGRIIAELKEEGYTTLLSVKHEKQKQALDLVTTVGSQAAKWQDTSGDYQIARDVLVSVEKALGHEEPELKLGERQPSRVIEISDCIVPPEAAGRINELKARRRDLVTEVRAMDKQILDSVYAGNVEQAQSDVERLKTRKATMEGQITAIDREILSLVISD
jgi:hypothetical protein